MLAIITFLILFLCILYFFMKLKKIGLNFASLSLIIGDGLKEPFKSQSSSFRKLSMIRSLNTYLCITLFLVLLLSSFIPTIFTLEHLSGLFLIIHVTIAPLFAISLTLVILFYSYNLRFSKIDIENLRNVSQNRNNVIKSVVKLFFWILAVLAIPLLLSIILILYPVFGTELQNINIIIHRISALLFSIGILGLSYSLILSKKL